VRSRIAGALPGQEVAGVLIALAIGDQQSIGAQQWTVFTRTGVNHLMSISGLHITMVAGLALGATLRVWRRSAWLTSRLAAQRAAALAGLAVAAGYAALSGFGVPAQRTVIMLAVVALALLLGRRISSLEVLAAALLTVTILDPWACLSAGFWLSFAAVALIMYVTLGRIGRDGWLTTWMRVQWAITIGLTPILVALFQQVSLVSPLANAAAIPMVSLGVVPLTLLGAVLPSDLPLQLAAWLMDACDLLLAFLGNLPQAVWEQHAPPGWTVAAAAGGGLWLLAPGGVPARWLGVLAMLPVFTLRPDGPMPGTLWLDVLDVGQGHAAVLRTAHHTLLYDTGPAYSIDVDGGNRIVVPHLRASGVSRLDGLIVSHNDGDHSGGLLSVLQAVPVDWVATSLPAAEPALALAPRSLRCFRGQAWEWDGVRFEVLHPSWDSYNVAGIKDNDRSCVLRVRVRGAGILLTADIERTTEQQLLAQFPANAPVDVMLVPHHGSVTSSTEAFLAQFRPRHALIPVGYRNRFGHPSADVLARYDRVGARVWRTDRDGALLVRIGEDVSVRSWRAVRPRYWHVQ
jgi:competence protein ComEC